MIEGGAGADILDGGEGVDTLDYSFSSVRVRFDLGINFADAEGDTIKGFENLIGSALDDSVAGSDGANVLSLGAGDDGFFGKLGRDELTGGAGADGFQYVQAADSGVTAATRDVIHDFSQAQLDQLDLHNFDADSGKPVSRASALSAATGSRAGPGALLLRGRPHRGGAEHRRQLGRGEHDPARRPRHPRGGRLPLLSLSSSPRGLTNSVPVRLPFAAARVRQSVWGFPPSLRRGRPPSLPAVTPYPAPCRRCATSLPAGKPPATCRPSPAVPGTYARPAPAGGAAKFLPAVRRPPCRPRGRPGGCLAAAPGECWRPRLRFQTPAAAAGLGRKVDPEEPDDGTAAGASAGRERHLEAVGRPGRAVTAVTHGPVGYRAARSGRDCQREDGLLQQQAQREQDGVGVDGGAGEHGLSGGSRRRGRYRTKSVAWKFTTGSISIRISAPAAASSVLTSTTVSPAALKKRTGRRR